MTFLLRNLNSALLLTGLAITAACDEAQAQGSAPALTIREDLPDSGITVKQVIYGNGTFLACLLYPVRLYKSQDGVHWSKITGPPLGADTSIDNYRQISSVAFGAGRFVLVSDSGRIFSSSDLSSWSPAISGTTHKIVTVKYLNGNFYAVGDTATFLFSPDGLTWTARTTGIGDTTGSYQEVLYGNGHLVVTAINHFTDPNATQVVYDSSSAGWTSDSSRSFNTHGWARGRFYEFSPNSTSVSTDIQSWSAIPATGNGVDVFEDDAHVYLVTADYDIINGTPVWHDRVSSSDDGLNFGPVYTTVVPGGGGGAYFNNRYFIFGGLAHGPMAGSDDGLHYRVLGNSTAFLSTNGNIHVKLSVTTDAAYVYSGSDFINWTIRDTVSGAMGLIYDGVQFWSVGTKTYTSPDGITWTDRGASAHSFAGIAYGSGRYIAWSSDLQLQADTLWYSSDGATWAQAATPTASNPPQAPPSPINYGIIKRVRFLNGHIFVVADGVILHSTDGVTYSLDYGGNTLGQYLTEVSYNADSAKYYFFGLGGINNGLPYLTTTAVADPFAGTSGLTVVTDTVNNLPTNMSLANFSAVAYNHGHFVSVIDNTAFAPYPNSYLIWSGDGVHWDSRMLDRETQFTSALSENDVFAIEGTHNYEILADFASTIPLPVSLLNFRAVAEDNVRVQLSWETAFEQNSMRFIIQREGADQWDSIGSIPASGSSHTLLGYQWSDEHPLPGNNKYRLALIDADNSSRLSEVKQAFIGGDVRLTIYPNPAKDWLVIQWTGDEGEGVVTLYDGSGRVMVQKVLVGASLEVPMSTLPTGVYYLMIRFPNGKVYRKEILH
ncbi:MAG: T9SS type A sorting domain-containing protein [Bacteroidetes bacterium]|nr:T9SS type A sorting domain-containing protein [Bacteroidota bacterium]